MNLFNKISLVLFFLLVSLSLAQPLKREPKPLWVNSPSVDYDAKPKTGEAGGYYYLLLDYQYNIAREETYVHYVYKVLTSEGVQQMSDLTVDFDPVYQKLMLNQLAIRRNGKVTDQLASAQIQVLQREQSMERFLYDGSLTTVIHLKDVRSGDIIECAYTRKGYNPVYAKHFSMSIYFDYSMPYEQLYNRIIAPSSKKLTIKNVLCETKPQEFHTEKTDEYIWVNPKTPALILESNVPYWYDPYRHVMISDFSSWSEVVDWAVKHFTVSNGELNKLKKRVAGQFKETQKEKLILEIIHFVQDEIRYLGFESGLNSHKPHSPLKIYDQRFGDCKDKSLLLCSILKLYGVDAYPMLVNTTLQNELTKIVPSHTAFNHCVVQICFNGNFIYIDPTISNQGGALDNYYFPLYGKGLVIKEGTTSLVDVNKPEGSTIQEEQVLELDSIGGSAKLSIKTEYKGKDADIERCDFADQSLESIQKKYKEYYENVYPDLQIDEPVQVIDNRDTNIFTVKESYRIQSFWKPNQDKKDKIYCEAYSLVMENYSDVKKSTNRKAPYRIDYPTSYEQFIKLKLPESWTISEDDTLIKSPYYSYKHTVTYDDSSYIVTLYHNYKTMADNVPADYISNFVKDHEAIGKNLSYMLTYDKSLAKQSGFSWVAFCIAVVALVVAVFLGIRLYLTFDPPAAYPAAYAQPIGGWLILLMINISLNPVYLMYSMIKETPFFDTWTWMSYYNSHMWGLLALVFIELVFNVFCVVFSVVILILFFQRRSSLPQVISFYFIGMMSATVLDSFLTDVLINKTAFGQSTNLYRNAYSSVFAVLIWVPYFRLSVRVRKTFVKRLEDLRRKKQPVPEITLYSEK